MNAIVGMTAIATARRIQEELGDHVPIPPTTGGEIEHEAREAGVTGFISKPLFRSTLFNSVRQFAGVDQEAEQAAQTEASRNLDGRRILLAEGIELNWEIASELLGAEGLKLDWAENGRICVEMLLAALEGYYDAMLMDIRMPVMGGYKATHDGHSLSGSDGLGYPHHCHDRRRLCRGCEARPGLRHERPRGQAHRHARGHTPTGT